MATKTENPDTFLVEYTNRLIIQHLLLAEDHLLEYNREPSSQCLACLHWHLEKLVAYTSLECVKFEGTDTATCQSLSKWASHVQDKLDKLTQPKALELAKQAREFRYKLVEGKAKMKQESPACTLASCTGEMESPRSLRRPVAEAKDLVQQAFYAVKRLPVVPTDDECYRYNLNEAWKYLENAEAHMLEAHYSCSGELPRELFPKQSGEVKQEPACSLKQGGAEMSAKTQEAKVICRMIEEAKDVTKRGSNYWCEDSGQKYNIPFPIHPCATFNTIKDRLDIACPPMKQVKQGGKEMEQKKGIPQDLCQDAIVIALGVAEDQGARPKLRQGAQKIVNRIYGIEVSQDPLLTSIATQLCTLGACFGADGAKTTIVRWEAQEAFGFKVGDKVQTIPLGPGLGTWRMRGTITGFRLVGREREHPSEGLSEAILDNKKLAPIELLEPLESSISSNPLPVCTKPQAKKLESCILKVKARNVEAGCKPEGTGSKECPTPFAVCRASIVCRFGPGKKGTLPTGVH